MIAEPEETWISTLPSSPLPLLDVGACYGVQTIHALSQQRDVIALDMCEDHLKIFRQRVAALTGVRGKLVDTVCTKLPDKDAVPPASVSAILCSEVIHFLYAGEMRPVFHHFYRWLCPGGRLVLTTGAWPKRMKTIQQAGLKFRGGRTADETLKMLETTPPGELVDAVPGLAHLPEESAWREKIGGFLYLLSTVELRELASSAGFEVEHVKYYCSGKYGDARDEEESAQLIAGKPE